MLVLTRRTDETVVIGDPARPIAVVKVVEIRGDRIRLGVVADRSVHVHRGEVAGEIVAGVPKGGRGGTAGTAGTAVPPVAKGGCA